MSSPTHPLSINGRVHIKGVMVAAIRLARMLSAGTWQARMSSSLRTAWGWAKHSAASARARRVVLDRGQAVALLARIQGAAINRGRNLVGAAASLPALDDVLALARREFSGLPQADRPAVLASLPGGVPKFGGTLRPYRSTRDFGTGASRAASHAW